MIYWNKLHNALLSVTTFCTFSREFSPFQKCARWGSEHSASRTRGSDIFSRNCVAGHVSAPLTQACRPQPLRHFAIANTVNALVLELTRTASPFPIGFYSRLPGTPSSGLQLVGNTVTRTKVLLLWRLPSECRVWQS